MDKKSIGIYLIMKELGGFRVMSLEDRIFLQKSIYLLQLLGINLGYRFSWYRLGPYTSDLTTTAFQIQANIDQYIERFAKAALRKEVLESIDKLKHLLNKKPEKIEDHKWFELLSSIHYLKHISTTDPATITRSNISTKLMDAGKIGFDESHIALAWDCLHELGLIDRKSLPKIKPT
ncbi:MAG: hypothetical protein HRF51_03755 [bacterium]|jgi:uncharacterized protein YwgA